MDNLDIRQYKYAVIYPKILIVSGKEIIGYMRSKFSIPTLLYKITILQNKQTKL